MTGLVWRSARTHPMPTMIPVHSAVDRLISNARMQMIIACAEHTCAHTHDVDQVRRLVLACGMLENHEF